MLTRSYITPESVECRAYDAPARPQFRRTTEGAGLTRSRRSGRLVFCLSCVLAPDHKAL